MWTRSGQYLVNFEHDETGYILSVTDMHQTFTERLSIAEIERRGEELGLEVALSTGKQVSAFLAVVARLLRLNADIKSAGETKMCLKVEGQDLGVTLRWAFNLKQVSETESKQEVAELVTGLFGVVRELGHELARRNQIIRDKNEVIAGMDDAMMRRVEYRPPRQLERAFQDLETPPETASETASETTLEPKDALDLINQFWPASTRRGPKAEGNTSGHERNTDSAIPSAINSTLDDSDVTVDDGAEELSDATKSDAIESNAIESDATENDAITNNANENDAIKSDSAARGANKNGATENVAIGSDDETMEIQDLDSDAAG